MFENLLERLQSVFGSGSPADGEEAFAAQARYATGLALKFNTWVHRRTETFEFLDAYTVRRRMSVDFTLPEGQHLTHGQTVLVPLMILLKESLRNFDIEDSAGHSLTVLTTRQNGEVACRGLSLLLWASWPENANPEETLTRFLAEPDSDAALAEYSRALVYEPSLLQQALDNYPNPDEAGVIAALLEELTTGFMLMVSIPYEPGLRRNIKFSYDAAQKRIPWISASLSKILRVFSSLGLVARVEEFRAVPIGWSQSYHAEVVPPPDIYSAEAVLVPNHKDLKPVRDDHKQRPHVQIEGKRRGDKGDLGLVFYADREDLIFPLLLSAVALTATLSLVQSRPTTLSSEALVPVLLLPIALVAFFVRSSENSYIRKTLRGVRLVAGVPAAAGVTVAVMLGVDLLGQDKVSPHSVDVASWATHASIFASTLLVLALVSPALGSIRRWVVRKTSEWTTQQVARSEETGGRKRWLNDKRTKWLNKVISGAMTLLGLVGYAAIAAGVLLLFYAALPIGTEFPNAH